MEDRVCVLQNSTQILFDGLLTSKTRPLFANKHLNVFNFNKLNKIYASSNFSQLQLITELPIEVAGFQFPLAHFRAPAHHLLKVDGANPPRLLLHLVHALLSQVEVGLQVVSHHGEPQHAHQHDDPQPQGVERLLAHPAAEAEGEMEG